MGKFLGLGAKSGCGFFIPTQKSACFLSLKNRKFIFLATILDAILDFGMTNPHPDLAPRPKICPLYDL